MLYLSFRIIVFLIAIFGLINMMVYEEYTYVFFPLVIIFWSLYMFLTDKDKNDNSHYKASKPYEKNRGNGLLNALDDYDFNAYTRYRSPYYNYGSKTVTAQEYKKIVKRCKRGPKITIVKNKKENGTDTG